MHSRSMWLERLQGPACDLPCPCPMQVTLGDYPVVSPWRPLCTRTELMGATNFMVRGLRQVALPMVHGSRAAAGWRCRRCMARGLRQVVRCLVHGLQVGLPQMLGSAPCCAEAPHPAARAHLAGSLPDAKGPCHEQAFPGWLVRLNYLSSYILYAGHGHTRAPVTRPLRAAPRVRPLQARRPGQLAAGVCMCV